MTERLFFPLFVDLSDRKILVAGGGAVAERRVKSLLEFAGSITIVSPYVTDRLRSMIDPDHADPGAGANRCGTLNDNNPERTLIWIQRPYRPGDEDGMSLVLACTDDPSVNRLITSRARKARIPANNCSDRTDCDFLFPGLSMRGSVTVGITSAGEDHRLVKRIREETDKLLSGLLPDPEDSCQQKKNSLSMEH